MFTYLSCKLFTDYVKNTLASNQYPVFKNIYSPELNYERDGNKYIAKGIGAFNNAHPDFNREWILIMWNRAPIKRALDRRRTVTAHKLLPEQGAADVYPAAIARTELRMNFICSSPSTSENLEEFLAIKGIYQSFELTIQDMGDPFNVLLEDFSVDGFTHLSHEASGSLTELSCTCILNHPIFLPKSVGHIIKQINFDLYSLHTELLLDSISFKESPPGGGEWKWESN